MRQITYTLIVGLCAAWLWLPEMSGAAEMKLPDPLPIETMRAAVYTKAFAKRFALPDPEPGTEPTGAIQGLEFQIRPTRGMAGYSCYLTLFLDNTLPIAWPEEARASVSGIPTQETQLLHNMPRERFLAMSIADRKYSSARVSLYGRKARIATPDHEYQKRGGSYDVTYREYDREFYPGVAYAKLEIDCGLSGTEFEKYLAYALAPHVEVWLLKVGGQDYRYAGGLMRDDFIRLPLPRNFIERVLPWIKAGAGYNKIEFEDRIRRERAQRMKESERQMKEWDKELADPAVRRELGEFLQRTK